MKEMKWKTIIFLGVIVAIGQFVFTAGAQGLFAEQVNWIFVLVSAGIMLAVFISVIIVRKRLMEIE